MICDSRSAFVLATRVQVTGGGHAWSEVSRGHGRLAVGHQKRKSIRASAEVVQNGCPPRTGNRLVAQLQPRRCVCVEVSGVANSGGDEVASLVSSADDCRAIEHTVNRL